MGFAHPRIPFRESMLQVLSTRPARTRQGGLHEHGRSHRMTNEIPAITLNNGVEMPILGFGVFQIPAIGKAYFLNPKEGKRTTSTGARSFRRLWKCALCRRKFSVLVRTIFEDSKIPICKWLMAYHMMSAAKNGISAKGLERVLEIS